MKNTFLKKVSAVALAAVMAVTFAPLASLTAFAETKDTKGPNVGVGGNDEIGSWDNPAIIKAPGTFKVRTNAGVNAGWIDINLDTDDMAAGDYKFNVTNSTKTRFNFSGSNTTKDVNIYITGEPTALTAAVQIPEVNFTFAADFANDSATEMKSISGNLHFTSKEKIIGTEVPGDNSRWSWIDTSKTQKFLQGGLSASTPLATVVPVGDDNGDDDNLWLGNIAISAVQHIDARPVDVIAYNGPVEVYKLKEGSSARVNDFVINHGTSIKAVAADKTALAQVSTTINFTYIIDNNGISVELPGTYTEDAYYSGKDRIESGIQDSPIPCNGTTASFDIKGTYIKTGETRVRTVAAVTVDPKAANKLLDDADIEKIKAQIPGTWKQDWWGNVTNWSGTLQWAANEATYDQAITVTMNGDDWKGATINAYRADSDPNKTYARAWYRADRDVTDGVITNYHPYFKYGETYYTMDPSAFTKSEDGIAKVDGTKYFVSYASNNELTNVAGPHASKSVDILRGTEIKATAGNDLAYDRFDTTSTDLAVTAPADMSLVKETADTVVGRYQDVEYSWRAFGNKRHSGQGQYEKVYAYPYKAADQKRTTESINVAQVASGSVMSVYVDPRVKITKADNLGYFETDVQSAQFNAANNIVGADWQLVTFGDVAKVTKEFVKSVKAEKSEAEYYASKEIKTVVSGVDPDVVIKGEINADVTDTAANGTKTWDVNTNAAKEKSQVTAHRMYSGREHVYTADPKEIEMLVAAGWKDEGPAFTVNAVASGKGTPIYRLYNKNNGGMHFYTASAAEKDMLLANGWTEGKPVFYGADKATGIPVYRTYNTGSNNGEHNYTTNMAEVEMNVQKGWRAEGVAFYVFK